MTSGSVEYVYDERNMLTGITTGSTDFTVAYDPFGNMSEVSANERQLAEYEYNANNGKLVKITYGNGDFVRYVYDSLENVKEIWYNNTKAYEYTYTSDGQVHKIENLIDGTATLYKYDTNNRVVSVLEYTVEDMYNDLEIVLGYDKESRVDSMQQSLRYSSGNKVRQARLQYVYSYDQNDGKIISTSITGSVNANISYTYDAFDRLTAKSYGGISNSFTYVNAGDNTTHLVSTHTVTINGSTQTVTYTYDKDGNIINISYGGSSQISYVYDSLGQLTRENNSLTGKTYLYKYDNAGNLIRKQTLSYTTAKPFPIESEIVYEYTDSSLGDLLTSYDGVAFTYDEIGNPLYYYNGEGYNFTWNNRTLVSATKGGVNMSFTYDSDGMRQTKTVGNETTRYYYCGTLLLAMENTSGETFVFIYDESGSPIGFQYRTTSYAVGAFDTYWYKKSLQGDITAVYSSNGTLLVSYTYDAWGNFTTQEHNGASTTAAVKNPLRYRGYFYDDDLDLYYLASRYYDARVGRFISPDSYLSTGQGMLGHNMYAYCNNNPVNHYDPKGKWTISIGGTAGFVVIGGVSIGISISLDDNWNLGLQITKSNVFEEHGGAVIGGIGAGIDLKGSLSLDADTIYDLEGQSFSLSGSFSNFGAEVSSSDISTMESVASSTNVFSVMFGTSTYRYGTANVTASETETIGSFNIVETAKNLWGEIASWFK